MADTDVDGFGELGLEDKRRQQRPFGDESGGCDLPLFPPGPDDFDVWARLLDRTPEVEPALCGVAHGVANRVDSLRACGNGVVPLQAAVALLSLLADF